MRSRYATRASLDDPACPGACARSLRCCGDGCVCVACCMWSGSRSHCSCSCARRRGRSRLVGCSALQWGWLMSRLSAGGTGAMTRAKDSTSVLSNVHNGAARHASPAEGVFGARLHRPSEAPALVGVPHATLPRGSCCVAWAERACVAVRRETLRAWGRCWETFARGCSYSSMGGRHARACSRRRPMRVARLRSSPSQLRFVHIPQSCGAEASSGG